MILSNLNLVYKSTIKIILFIILSIISTQISAQNPVLEFAKISDDNNPTGDGPVLTSTVNFVKNNDNPTGTSFSNYSSPSTLSVTATLSNQMYDLSGLTTPAGCTFLGDVVAPAAIFPLMNIYGNPANNSFTSAGSTTTGTGINITHNRGILTMITSNPLEAEGRSTSGRWQMADITFTFNRPVNNPILHLAGMGGNSGNLAFSAEYEFIESNTTVSFSKLSGTTAFSVTTTKILNSASPPAASGSGVGNGSVLITGSNITSLKLRIFLRGSGGGNWARTTAIAGDAVTMGFSVAESDLAITKTVDNNKPKPDSDVVFTLTAKNNGLSNNTGVSVTDLLPSGYTFKSATPSTGTTYNSSTGIWSIGNLNSAATATLNITATVKQNGIFDNSATISAISGINDPEASNNMAICEVKIDSDGDGVVDMIDLDDDNDGILDINEGFYNSTQSITGGDGGSTNTFTKNGVVSAYFDFVTVDNSISFTINGTTLNINNILQFLGEPATGEVKIVMASDNAIVDQPWNANTNGLPRLKVVISENGKVELYGTRTTNATSLELLKTRDNSPLNYISFNSGENTFTIVNPNGDDLDGINGTGYFADINGTDTDSDGIPNHLDTDSDKDDCYDAIEGSDNVISEHLKSNGSINTATNGGVDSDGVPNLVNTGGAADTDNKQAQSAGNAYNSTLNSCENYWIGTTGNSWEDAINWAAQEMPVPGEDLIFATVDNNNGTAAVNDLKLPSGTEKTVDNLINLSAKAIIIPAGSGLIVEGTVSGSETNANKIVLEASANTPNGTLLVKNGCATTVMATVQLYAKGNKGTTIDWKDNIPGSPTFGQWFSSSYKWQYFGIPVSSIKADPAFYGSFLREYSEPKNAANSYYNKWNTLNNASILTAFKGYAITQDNPKVISLQGKLELCDREIKLTRTAAEVTESTSNNIENKRYGLGQNIFGNSFTGAIPIDQIDFNNIKVDGSATTNDGTLVEKTVYLYNTGSFGEWAGVIGQVSADAVTAGAYRAIPNNVSSVVYNQIPSMQGFLLRHTGTFGTEITMTLPYAKLAKNTKPQTAPRAPLSHLEIELNSASTIDKLWLFSIPGTGNKFDNGWDGRKHFGTPTAFIYAPTADGNMQVNTTDNLIGTAIAFVPNEDKHYSLTLKKSNLDTQYDSLYLIDLMLNKAIALHGEVTTYEFSADQKGIASVRFFISNNPQTAAPEKSGLLWAYSSKKQLHAYNRTNEKCTIQIYDQIGRNMLAQNIAAQSSIQLNPNLHTGFYLVKMNAGNQSHATMIHFE